MEMKDMIFMNDCYCKEFEATITAMPDERTIILNRTAFYPLGGGQPADTGILIKKGESDGTEKEEFSVINTRKENGEIVHIVDADGLQVGDLVKGIINWQERYIFMRYHTALHVLSAVICNKTDAKITGNNISLEKARMDFSLQSFDKEQMGEYVKEANHIIKKNIPVHIKILDRETIDLEKENLVKLAKTLPDYIKEIRVIDIKGFDTQACGGCHVANTSEIGYIEVLKIDNKGKNNRRLSFRLLNDMEVSEQLEDEISDMEFNED